MSPRSFEALPFDLLLITDPRGARDLLADTRAAVEAAPPGRLAVLVRIKGAEEERAAGTDAAGLARALLPRCRARGVALLVHGDLELALALGGPSASEASRAGGSAGAVGLHLPEGPPGSVAAARRALGPGALLGASRHDRAGLLGAQAEGASYATLSPLFAVPGKGSPLGPAAFAACLEGLAMPGIALGGIGPAEVHAALGAGAKGVAVRRAIYGAADPGEACLELLRRLDAPETPVPRTN